MSAVLADVSLAVAQPPPPVIEITEPADSFALGHGDKLKAKGTSDQPNTQIKLVVVNEFNMITNSHTAIFNTDANGNWEDPQNMTVYGPGTWSVHVHFTGNEQHYDNHDGTVLGPPP